MLCRGGRCGCCVFGSLHSLSNKAGGKNDDPDWFRVSSGKPLFWPTYADFCVPPAELEPWVIVLVFCLLVGGRFYTCLWVKSHTSLQEVSLCSRFCHRLWRGSTGCPSQRIGLTCTDRTDGHRWLAAFSCLQPSGHISLRAVFDAVIV